jgi:hypothetical protein
VPVRFERVPEWLHCFFPLKSSVMSTYGSIGNILIAWYQIDGATSQGLEKASLGHAIGSSCNVLVGVAIRKVVLCNQTNLDLAYSI